MSLTGRTDRQRAAFFLKIRTESGQLTDPRQTESGQTDTGQKIRTADRHPTRFSGKSGQKRDKDRTRTVLSADDSSQFGLILGSLIITFDIIRFRSPFRPKVRHKWSVSDFVVYERDIDSHAYSSHSMDEKTNLDSCQID